VAVVATPLLVRLATAVPSQPDVAVVATPLLVRLATAVLPALPAGAVAKLELLVLVLGVEEEVTGGS